MTDRCFCYNWGALQEKIHLHGACKCVWFGCGLDFCCCALFWNSHTSLCSALLNYEVLWPPDRMLGWGDMTMEWDIIRAFQPQSKILDKIENINIWGRDFQQKITRTKPFPGKTGINKAFSISVWRKNMFSEALQEWVCYHCWTIFKKYKEEFFLPYWEQQTGSLGGAVCNYFSVSWGKFFWWQAQWCGKVCKTKQYLIGYHWI